MSGDGSLGTVFDHPLFGRDSDLAAIRSFVDRAADGGGALVLSGDAGVGKTVLLDSAAAWATAARSRVLRATGAEFEVDLSFAGLNQLLHPLFADLPGLSDVHRRALSVALGLDDGSPSDRLVVSNAALELLVQAAATRPLLAIVDDVPWLDRASAAVLAFVARRLTGTRVGLLAAARTGEDSFFERSGIAGRDILPLDDIAAAALLNERFPALTPRVRQRLVAEAQGNPLALLELPAALGPRSAPSGPLPAVLPLGRRLQTMFAGRVENLPTATRDVLLIAVLDGTGELGVLESDDTGTANIDHLASAERARLVSVDAASRSVVFRHPLIRSAVVELSTIDERRRAHIVIAERRANQPARQAWHLAEAAIGPDERVAALLNSVAHENARRGDAVGAISALLRAAELSPDGRDRSARLAKAAYLGATATGDLRQVAELLDAAGQADPEGGGALAGAIAGAYHLLNADGDVDTAYRLLLGAIDTFPHASDARHQPLLEALYNLSMISFFGGRPELWEPVHRAIDRLVPHPPELLALLDKTFSDPARLALPMMNRLDIAIGELNREPSPVRIARASTAAAYVDRLSGCRSALLRVVCDGRDGGAITSAIEAMFLLGIDDFFTGAWDDLSQLSQEGLELCRDRDYRLLAWTGLFLQAMVAAARGDEATAEHMADEMAGWAASRHVRAVAFYASHIRTLAAFGRGDFENAYGHATAVSPAGVLASHVPHALWLVIELVEAAVRTGRRHEAEAHVAAANELRLSEISPRLALVTAGSAALCATDETARAAFETALAVPGAERWPFDLARVELAYGERLRRLKAATEARRHLTAALEIFERLGARPWAARASGELRAAGRATDATRGLAALALTPQQREIAMLAASGLTNKQIGERLFLSHRTVGTHLYQLFPKLGITSRAALRDALAQLGADE